MDPVQPPPPVPTIDLLLNLIDTRPNSILQALAQHPRLASAADAHGYSLVHAAASYGQLEVLRELVQRYNANVDLLDEDGETPLFVAETVEVARCLVDELGADTDIRNAENKMAEQKILEEEGDEHEVYRYLTSLHPGPATSALVIADTDTIHAPPPMPNGVQVNLGTMEEDDRMAPDPEIRSRIEALAARDDFQGEEGQRQLRNLVSEVVTGLSEEETGRGVRRRIH